MQTAYVHTIPVAQPEQVTHGSPVWVALQKPSHSHAGSQCTHLPWCPAEEGCAHVDCLSEWRRRVMERQMGRQMGHKHSIRNEGRCKIIILPVAHHDSTTGNRQRVGLNHLKTWRPIFELILEGMFLLHTPYQPKASPVRKEFLLHRMQDTSGGS
eukprot:scaffold58214_cov17-Tisochrysis_lutea.AAC.1